ncbi:hypothetical protein AB1N83_007716 [Pleurotus pulmonarius]
MDRTTIEVCVSNYGCIRPQVYPSDFGAAKKLLMQREGCSKLQVVIVSFVCDGVCRPAQRMPCYPRTKTVDFVTDLANRGALAHDTGGGRPRYSFEKQVNTLRRCSAQNHSDSKTWFSIKDWYLFHP